MKNNSKKYFQIRQKKIYATIKARVKEQIDNMSFKEKIKWLLKREDQ